MLFQKLLRIFEPCAQASFVHISPNSLETLWLLLLLLLFWYKLYNGALWKLNWNIYMQERKAMATKDVPFTVLLKISWSREGTSLKEMWVLCVCVCVGVYPKGRCFKTKPKFKVFNGCRELEESASMVLNLKMRALHVCLTSTSMIAFCFNNEEHFKIFLLYCLYLAS